MTGKIRNLLESGNSSNSLLLIGPFHFRGFDCFPIRLAKRAWHPDQLNEDEEGNLAERFHVDHLHIRNPGVEFSILPPLGPHS